MAILTLGLIIGMVGLVSLSIPKGEKVDFYESTAAEVAGEIR